MICLCCGKEIKNPTIDEQKSSWHHSCIKRFFDVDTLPQLDISPKALTNIVKKDIDSGYTITGVQKKLSLHLSNLDTPRLTLVNYPVGYILKPQTEEYANLPEYEFITMLMAKIVSIKTVPFGLMRIGDEYAYISKRIDRVISKNGTTKLAMEDFCQLDQRLTQDKYKGSYEGCGKIINRYSSTPTLDLSEFFLRIVFSFIVGNSDMHLKNFSLIDTEKGYALSPAYDLLPVNIILPQDLEQTALTISGKKKNLKKKEFLNLANSIGLQELVANRLIKLVVSKKEQLLKVCDNNILSEKQNQEFKELIKTRYSVFE